MAAQSLNKSDVIAEVCHELEQGSEDEAARTLRLHYPFAPENVIDRSYGPVESTRVFVRDGFLDRYTGERLIFPPVLRLISRVLPHEFPFHPNWKTDVTHPAYWEVGATIDHLVPVSRGGSDDESNWMTTSMARNSAKMKWTLRELGWQLHPPGDLADWDGMMSWFVKFAVRRPSMLQTGYIRQWFRAAQVALK